MALRDISTLGGAPAAGSEEALLATGDEQHF